MAGSILTVLLLAGPGFAQSMQATPGSSALSASRTPQPISSSAQQQSSTTSVPSHPEPGDDDLYKELIRQGMKPGAATYFLENYYNTDSRGANPAAFVNDVIQSKVERSLSENYDRNYLYAQQLSVDAYFLSSAPSGYEEFASSYVSVWYSYQSITPDASESVRLHDKVDPPATVSSRALGKSLIGADSGFLAAFLAVTAGIVPF